MKVSLSKTVVRGKRKWMISRTVGGKRVRTFFDSKRDAEDEQAQLLDQMQNAGQVWLALSAKERGEIAQAIAEMRERGLTVGTVWGAYKQGAFGNVKERRTLAQAIEETIQSKRAAKRRSRTIENLELYLKQFARGREGMMVDTITPRMIEQWFDGRKEADTTRQSNLGRLSSMFDLCFRRDYIAVNPCLKVERVSVSVGKPRILSRMQILRLLAVARKREQGIVAYFILGLVCGLRPEEADKLTWADIDFQRKRIELSEEKTKVRLWRFVPLERSAILWLRWSRRFVKGDLIPKQLRRRRRRVCKRARIKWSQDVLRKTAASYLMAKYQDAAKVSEWLGNSPAILRKHYRTLVEPDAAKWFFGDNA